MPGTRRFFLNLFRMVTLVTQANEESSKRHEETTERDLKNFQNRFEEKSCP